MICVPLHDGEISFTSSKCMCLNTKRHITKDRSQHLRAFKMTSNSQNFPTSIISQPPTVMVPGERRGHRKITVASLCCDADEADSALTAWTEDHQSCELKASFTSHANPTRANHHQFERPGLAVTLPLPLPLPLPAHSRYDNGFGLATQPSPSSYFDTTEILGAACDVIDSTSGSVLQSNKSVYHDADLRVQATTQRHTLGPLGASSGLLDPLTRTNRYSSLCTTVLFGSARGPR